jgi:cysteine desulfurase
MRKIYFDNAATTQVDDRVIQKVTDCYRDVFGNPASVHGFGQKAQHVLDESREVVASFFNVGFNQVLFTSGATESNNLLLHHFSDKKIVTSDIEHSSIHKTVQKMQKEGSDVGNIPIADLPNISKAADLASCMLVNNETGLISDITQLIESLKENAAEGEGGLVHSDVVQGLYWADFNTIKADFYSATAHKVHGPKGIGVLIIPEDFDLDPLMIGGSQEFDKRPGTVNIPGVVGFAEALTHIDANKHQIQNTLNQVSKHFKEKIHEVGGLLLQDRVAHMEWAPHIVSVIFEHNAEELMQFLSMKGIAVSKGSACSSGSTLRSHVLTALGLSDDEADRVLRFSFSKNNTTAEIDAVIEEIKQFARL